MFLDVDELLKILGDRRSVDDKGGGHILRDVVRIVLVVDVDPFFLKLKGQLGLRPVIAGDRVAFELIVSGDGAHADATDPKEVNL